ncbi:MAG TPA: hypothetical protein VFT04_12990, partial [Gemmatimonadales bacterium]|nr:hypothetical protein [Gemmatimonadales bacterium]
STSGSGYVKYLDRQKAGSVPAQVLAKLVSILTGLVRPVGEAATSAATDTNPIQVRTMRFTIMGVATKEFEARSPGR